MAEKFSQEKFIAKVIDAYNSINSLNQYVQGTRFIVIDHAAKITVCYEKLILWPTYVDRDEFSMFPELEKYIAGKRMNVKDTIIGHLEKLNKTMEHYYGDIQAPANK